ncbi:MAG: PHP domain-containing protein [Candidatus Solibacter usitatus]|nr:PHP domain-containing protein [Candidatus Solibacter usitatus]
MKQLIRRSIFLLLFVSMLIAALFATQAGPAASGRWYKGNLHTHTLNSDGDSTPLEVATWYREHGYQFLVLSDHNYLTPTVSLNEIVGAAEKFLLIPGEEVTDSFEKKPMHMNAVNLAELVRPAHGTSMSATIQNNVDAIRKAKALPTLNHPNFHWSISVQDMLAVNGLTHFEVYNGHPQVNNPGGGGSPSLDQMWDALLTAGRRVYGVAVDDAHRFKAFPRKCRIRATDGSGCDLVLSVPMRSPVRWRPATSILPPA